MKKKGQSDIFKYQPEIPVDDTRTGCQQVQASCLRGSVCHRGREGEESRTFQSLIDLKFHFLYATPQDLRPEGERLEVTQHLSKNTRNF